MARKVLVRLVDDLDGMPSDDVGTVTFSLDRVTYQIDLNAANASKLRDGLAEFVAAARRTGGRVKRGAGVRAGGAGNDGPAIREWARAQGHQLAERGRIPSHIVDAFRSGGGRAKATATADGTAAKPARTAPKAAATGRGTTVKTAAASRTATKATAKAAPKAAPKTEPKTTRKAAPKPAAKSTKARSTAADKTKSTKAGTGKAAAKTPRTAASTAARGQRARRGPGAKSR